MANETQMSWSKRILIGVGVIAILLVEVGVAYMLNKKIVVPKYYHSGRVATASETTSGGESPRESPKKDAGKTEDSAEEPAEESTKGSTESTTPSPAELNANIYMINDLIINPAGSQGGRYVAMSIGLGVDQQPALDELKTRDIQIRDAIIALLSQKTLGKFVSIEERLKLKQEILDLVNEKLNSDDVESIYFTEYVIQ